MLGAGDRAPIERQAFFFSRSSGSIGLMAVHSGSVSS
jgi:hypothetical protein